ncbi:hypothetical protein IQ247_30930 [Plectonema cf. radiosum LEGE 06105]|uniref:Uncharacterized protein n=1 Tax=Plectonema cf. radiosum LEGE 06105 TaxID=945769 RepID=A0A8J7K8D4_9CYAN|nr:hypothetical protein [Plectonema radiosum]MBE9217017.1 hypothetical protein [Plectonema cf. radiosum LEGE 06105]
MPTGLKHDDSQTSITNNEEIKELHKKIEQLHKQVEELQTENKELHNQLQKSSVSDSQLPDLEKLKTKVLNKMKVGGQSTAGKTLDAFIKELKSWKQA